MTHDQLFETDTTYSVGELGETIRLMFTQNFQRDVWVKGHVSGLNRHSSGNVFFELIEPANEPGRQPIAKLSVVLLRDTKNTINRQIKAAGGGMRIDDGVELRIRATPEFYAPNGRISLKMSGIDPTYTLGRMEQDRQRLLSMLRTEGLLERNALLAMPMLPLRVGLVTARGSAASADFLTELSRLPVAWEITHIATRVQGEGSHLEVAAAITGCARRNLDVIAVVRGGGARTDLAAFDHETVARAIAQCPIPVITGVGHEIDRSVADEVAHLALKTPTACATHLIELVNAASASAERAWEQISQLASARLTQARTHVDQCGTRVALDTGQRLADSLTQTTEAAHLVRARTERRLARAQQSLATHGTRVDMAGTHRLHESAAALDRAANQLTRAVPRLLERATQRVDRLAEQQRLLDPVHALARGWSITRNSSGQVVRSVEDLAPGEAFETTLADGRVAATVDAVTPSSPPTSPPSA